jgi:hypothetical protein
MPFWAVQAGFPNGPHGKLCDADQGVALERGTKLALRVTYAKG